MIGLNSRTIKIWASFVLVFFLAVAHMGSVSAQASKVTQIVADQFVVRDSENKSEFRGNVVVTQPGLTVWADVVVVN